MNVGDEVLIRMRDGADPRKFGSAWRMGIVMRTGVDILGSGEMVDLDDDGPTIYGWQIDFVSVLRAAETGVHAPEPVIYDGR